MFTFFLEHLKCATFKYPVNVLRKYFLTTELNPLDSTESSAFESQLFEKSDQFRTIAIQAFKSGLLWVGPLWIQLPNCK